jgi:hypothetical protein
MHQAAEEPWDACWIPCVAPLQLVAAEEIVEVPTRGLWIAVQLHQAAEKPGSTAGLGISKGCPLQLRRGNRSAYTLGLQRGGRGNR